MSRIEIHNLITTFFLPLDLTATRRIFRITVETSIHYWLFSFNPQPLYHVSYKDDSSFRNIPNLMLAQLLLLESALRKFFHILPGAAVPPTSFGFVVAFPSFWNFCISCANNAPVGTEPSFSSCMPRILSRSAKKGKYTDPIPTIVTVAVTAAITNLLPDALAAFVAIFTISVGSSVY